MSKIYKGTLGLIGNTPLVEVVNIEKELGCRFIRVSDKNSDEYNIGYVIKNIFNL